MEIKLDSFSFFLRKRLLMNIMRFFFFLCITTVFGFTPKNMLSQNSKIKIAVDRQVTVDEIFDLIMEQTDYKFIYQEGIFKDLPKVEIKKGIVTANSLLEKSLSRGSFNVTLTKSNTVIVKKIINAVALEITGIVTDNNGDPLPGASVIEKGTSNGTETDFDGKFTLTVSGVNAQLDVNFIGFATKTITITDGSNLTIKLEEDTQSLDEIVIVGYGKKKKSHLTGAVAKIGGADIAAIQSTRVDDALQGKLAGVRIQSTDSQPGAAPKIQIRSAGSITGAGNPLIIVDGFPISGDLSTVNPTDIESLEVLKDASSAAIYGSRGANGVILVTTKQGRSNKPQYSYNTYLSSTSAYKKNLDIYPTIGEHIQNIENNSSISDTGVVTSDTWSTGTDLGISNFDVLFAARLQAYKDVEALGFGTDYLDNALNTGITTNHDFNVRGGSENVKYFASVGYLDAEGSLQESDYERYTGRINLDINLTDKLKVGFSFNGIASTRNLFPLNLTDAIRTQGYVPTRHTAESIAFVQEYDQFIASLGLAQAVGTGPALADLQPGDYGHEWHFNRTNVNGVANGIGLSFFNGAQARIENRSMTEETFFGNVNGYLEYEILEGLIFKSTIGADLRDFTTFDNIQSPGTANGNGGTNQNEANQLTTSWLSQNTLNYSKEIKKHTIGLLAGYEFGRERFKELTVAATQNLQDNLLTFSSFNEVITNNREEFLTRKSVFFRGSYAYDDKYLFSVSIRRDGDSRFGSNNQWANFPAVSFGWNIHKESFFDVKGISKLKARASFGRLGSTEGLGAYDALSILETVTTTLGDSNAIGFTSSNLENPDLSWQITEEKNFGLDIGFLNNRLNVSVDYFISDTEDMLLNKEISGVTGFTSTPVNQGSIQSKGLEIEIGANIISNDNFSWNLSANFSDIDTEVIDTGNEEGFSVHPSNQTPQFRTYAGGQVSEYWGYETTGQEIDPRFLLDPSYPINGTARDTYVVDQNGDNVINEEDFVKLGANAPDFTWGFSSDFRYKDFDLSLVMQGSHGAEVVNTDDFFFGAHWKGIPNSLFAASEGSNLVAEKVDTDLFIQDASYAALRNVTLGYTLSNDKLSDKFKFQSIRFYIAATNLLYLVADDYTGLNPEGVNFVTDSNPLQFGGQKGATPINRSFTMGLNFNF